MVTMHNGKGTRSQYLTSRRDTFISSSPPPNQKYSTVHKIFAILMNLALVHSDGAFSYRTLPEKGSCKRFMYPPEPIFHWLPWFVQFCFCVQDVEEGCCFYIYSPLLYHTLVIRPDVAWEGEVTGLSPCISRVPGGLLWPCASANLLRYIRCNNFLFMEIY